MAILVTHLRLLALAAATSLLAAAAQTLEPPSQAKPGCTEKCGDLTIPYPFGMGKNCSMRPEFTVACDQSTTASPTANFTNGTFTFPITITNFSLENGELQVMQAIAQDCYDDEGNNTQSGSSLELPAPYTISTKNNFFTLGCNVLAVFDEIVEDADSKKGVSSAFCLDVLGKNIPTSCTGFGCSRTSIPSGMQNISIGMSALDSYNATDPWQSRYKCSYSFIVEQDNFTFDPNTSFQQLSTTNAQLPVAVNWAIGDESCEVAKTMPNNYACQDNANCVNRSSITNGAVGYICKCLPGYEGNPYLGCQDIDDCKKGNPCENGVCENIPGNYSCKCIKGFRNEDSITCVQDTSSNNTSLKISLGISISFLVVVLLISWIYWEMNKRKLIKLKQKHFKENGGFMLQQQLASHGGTVETAKIYTEEELEKATNNYHADEILGEGSYGTVYRGVLADSKIVAIKKSKIGAPTQSDQFVNEVIVLSQINHRNVVKLLGCCFETEVPSLVYEYITHGTLSEHLFNNNKRKGPSLPWELRLKIASETAGALAYLHSSTSTPIIHRDVKSTNILLDENYTAKVADFGASRFIPLDQTELATLVQGTLGYLDPEYFHTNQLTEKSDVYSFGVVLAELLTSRIALSFARPDEERCLASFFVSSIEKDRLVEILDPNIANEGNVETVMQVAYLAKTCLRVKGEERPTMKEVAAELEGMQNNGKHPWRNKVFSSPEEESEYLLGSPMNSEDYIVNVKCDGDEGASSTTYGYDSMQIQTIVPYDDGR